MSNPVPSDLSLTTIADSSEIVASDHRNNYTALQDTVNAILAILRGGTAGQALTAVDANDVAWGAMSAGVTTVASGTFPSTVSTTGTSFATGADLLGTALSFTADGTSSYLLLAFAQTLSNLTSAKETLVFANLDGAQGDAMGAFQAPTELGTLVPFFVGASFLPASGAHTVNVRIWSASGGTANVQPWGTVVLLKL